MTAIDNEVDVELARQRLDELHQALFEGTNAIPGFRPDIANYRAELQTMKDILIRRGLTTELEYTNRMIGHMEDTIGQLIDLGAVDQQVAINLEL